MEMKEKVEQITAIQKRLKAKNYKLTVCEQLKFNCVGNEYCKLHTPEEKIIENCLCLQCENYKPIIRKFNIKKMIVGGEK